MKKVALITGASSGIWLDTGLRLIDEGYKVYGAARRTDAMAELVKKGGTALYLNLCDERSIEECVKQVLEAEGQIDLLVNNAGFGLGGSIEEIPLEEAKKQLVEMKREQEVLKKFKEENDELSNQYKQLQQDINALSEKKESFAEEMQALKDFSKFKEELNVLLAKLAPLRFNERFDIINKHAMFVEEYLELINLVENWCRDMRSVIKNKNNNVLDGDFQEI